MLQCYNMLQCVTRDKLVDKSRQQRESFIEEHLTRSLSSVTRKKKTEEKEMVVTRVEALLAPRNERSWQFVGK